MSFQWLLSIAGLIARSAILALIPKCPNGTDAEIEVRQLFELEDFKPSEAVERFRELEAVTKK